MIVSKAAGDNLQSNRQAVGGLSSGDRGGRVPREIERMGKAPADAPLDGPAVDACRAERSATRSVGHGQGAERRRQEPVVLLEHALHLAPYAGTQQIVATPSNTTVSFTCPEGRDATETGRQIAVYTAPLYEGDGPRAGFVCD